MTTLESALVIRLREQLPNGRETAIQSFRYEVAQRGTPLVEPLPHTVDRVLVTFVWFSDEPVENVALIENFSVPDPCGTPLEQVGDTGIWARSFVMDADLRFAYRYSVNDSLISVYEDPGHEERFARFQPDPLNPLTTRLPFLEPAGIAPRDVVESMVELPSAAAAPEVAWQPGISRGTIERRQWTSAMLGNTREVEVYTPASYPESNQPCGLLIVFDGAVAVELLGISNTLDNMIAAGRIGPVVAVLVGSDDRSIEYPCNPAFADAIATELVPWVRREYRIADGPEHVATNGISYGGLASAWIALRHPEVVGNAISQSGSFQWRQGTGRIARDKASSIGEAPAYGWLSAQVAQWERKPVRLVIEAGRLEALNSGVEPSLLAETRHFRNVLIAKGYDVDYSEFAGAHDFINWSRTLPGHLVKVFGSS